MKIITNITDLRYIYTDIPHVTINKPKKHVYYTFTIMKNVSYSKSASIPHTLESYCTCGDDDVIPFLQA